MMSIYAQKLSLTMPDTYVNGIRAYLHGRLATNVRASKEIGLQFAISFYTGNYRALDDSYDSDVKAPNAL